MAFMFFKSKVCSDVLILIQVLLCLPIFKVFLYRACQFHLCPTCHLQICRDIHLHLSFHLLEQLCPMVRRKLWLCYLMSNSWYKFCVSFMLAIFELKSCKLNILQIKFLELALNIVIEQAWTALINNKLVGALCLALEQHFRNLELIIMITNLSCVL